MNIKVGDTVMLISGSRRDKKKTGKVLHVLADKGMVVVEGMNLKKKITRDASGKKASVEVPYPVHVSNIMFYDEKAKAPSRLGREGTGKEKHRVTKKSKTKLT